MSVTWKHALAIILPLVATIAKAVAPTLPAPIEPIAVAVGLLCLALLPSVSDSANVAAVGKAVARDAA